MEILKKILFKRANRLQVIGAVAGTFIGLFLLLTSLQLYHDLDALTSGEGNQTDQFVLINKKVNLFNTLGARSTFSTEEIDSLLGQSFIKSVGLFTPNQFKVSATSKMLGFYTELFFESVPDEFVDVEDPRWNWQPGQDEIPVVLSRDYLALYNFGFAPSQGLPQFTQNTIKRVTVDIRLAGGGRSQVFQGRIIGFSDRINSILIPQNFMNWANKKFGNSEKVTASRLILSTDNPYSSELSEYLKKHGYELSSGRLIGGELKTLIGKIISLVAIIGFVIALLSVLIFILNFQLVISQAREDIRLLLQLGYPPKQIIDQLFLQIVKLFGAVFLLTFVMLFISRQFFKSWIQDQGFEIVSGLHLNVYVLALLFSAAFCLINYRSIKKSVMELFYP